MSESPKSDAKKQIEQHFNTLKAMLDGVLTAKNAVNKEELLITSELQKLQEQYKELDAIEKEVPKAVYEAIKETPKEEKKAK